jgi:hypothetical protein
MDREPNLNVLYRGRSSLREIAARQLSGEPARRWFMSAHCDLIVWTGDDGAPQGFQFCYGKDEREHALTWMPGSGFSHCTVDCGAGVGTSGDGTPFLVPNGAPDAARILEIYRAESEAIPASYSGFIVAKLELLANAAESC